MILAGCTRIFSYLRRFPLDGLKVDRTFIKDLLADAGAATIVTAMINIGKSLHHRVIAEGVETREQVQFLQTQGCGEGQGYFFCHPVIPEKFAQFLESDKRIRRPLSPYRRLTPLRLPYRAFGQGRPRFTMIW